ncbi:Gfo/Idh/MocA family oxidoreductase [Streptomyces sp. WMMC500]|uniref:Gfo/Idh/MocA family protein n=1 Tax=Streptomyces sp. WMMC500 TaxID=3015154 RepID=UPI00248B5C8D|nr:Gfo/Idh/MocA family oxidoreductase [Streptomyces sp. WMMC500]WBB60088.1 Gfo/Idh/MocA family oxidoreductase [Streptomyces sp. WMMC500]
MTHRNGSRATAAGPAHAPAPLAAPVPVVLAGARGHGRRHLENIRRLARAGRVELAGICETRPLTAGEFAGAPVPQDADFAALLERTGARLAVVSTPIPTHADFAVVAAAYGVHLLLEKPPAPSYALYERIEAACRSAGIACQIGFQSLGSHAVPAIRALVAGGAVGAVRGIGAAGAWVRDEAYFRRAPWTGRRRLGGVDVVDGVLTNPLAHAVATALALDGTVRSGEVDGIELELYRAHDIEADDTSGVRLTTARGTEIVAAVTLCAERAAEPYVMVHGSTGRITFWYKEDRVLLQRAGHGPEEITYRRTDLLDNLLDHLRDGRPLVAPVADGGAFMRVVEAVRTAPDPVPLPAAAWRAAPAPGPAGAAPPAARRVVPGIDALVAAGAERLALYSELGAPWAAGSSEVSHV